MFIAFFSHHGIDIYSSVFSSGREKNRNHKSWSQSHKNFSSYFQFGYGRCHAIDMLLRPLEDEEVSGCWHTPGRLSHHQQAQQVAPALPGKIWNKGG